MCNNYILGFVIPDVKFKQSKYVEYVFGLLPIFLAMHGIEYIHFAWKWLYIRYLLLWSFIRRQCLVKGPFRKLLKTLLEKSEDTPRKVSFNLKTPPKSLNLKCMLCGNDELNPKHRYKLFENIETKKLACILLIKLSANGNASNIKLFHFQWKQQTNNLDHSSMPFLQSLFDVVWYLFSQF